MKYNVDCIILAAGTSSRMKKWKLLLPYRGGTILESCIDNALRVCRRVILVTGYRSIELGELFGDRKRLKIVENREYRKGVLTSVKAGVKEVETGHFFIMHGDLPLVTPDIYRKLLEHKGSNVLFPTYIEKRGHPVLLPETAIPFILNEKNKASVWDILEVFPKEFVLVPSESIYLDIDTEEDYNELINNKFRKR